MAALNKKRHVEAVKRFIDNERPFLGICVGMQVLFEQGTEFEEIAGFGLLKGRVEAIPLETDQNYRHKVPHIGWTELLFPDHRPEGERSILDKLGRQASTYYVHSYQCRPTHTEEILAYAAYDGHKITGAIQRHNIIGCQFHPEKSGLVGLEILRNFLGLREQTS